VQSSAAGTKSAKTRILVVEDDRTSRNALTALLRLSGYEVLNAATLMEGRALLADSPNCVILDLMLPDGNGSELLAYVRSHHLPINVIVTTGAIDWATKLSPPNATPDVIFPKPVDYRQLIDWLEGHCLNQ